MEEEMLIIIVILLKKKCINIFPIMEVIKSIVLQISILIQAANTILIPQLCRIYVIVKQETYILTQDIKRQAKHLIQQYQEIL